MSGGKSNYIINTMAVLSENIKELNIDEDGFVEIIKEDQFLSLFDQVEDFRLEGKITYKLSEVLMLVLLVIFKEGCSSFLSIADSIEADSSFYEAHHLIHDGNIPSHDTLRRIFTYLNSSSLYDETILGLYSFLKSLEAEVRKNGKYIHIAADGKEMCGSGRSVSCVTPLRNTAMLNIYESGTCTCLYSEPIDEKSNEIPATQNLLEKMNLKNCIITADALHCQKETASLIHGNGRYGKYVLTVKDNQAGLRNEIEARFTRYEKTVETVERGKRTFYFYYLPKGYATDGWSGMKVFVKMISKRNKKDTCLRYFISNSDNKELVCEAIEARWTIENDLHKNKDLIFHEDLIRVTDKNALQNLAVLNNLGLQLIQMYKAISGKEFRKAKVYFRHHPIECINLILTVTSSEDIISQLKQSIKKSAH